MDRWEAEVRRLRAEQAAKLAAEAGSSKVVAAAEEEEERDDEDGACWGCTSRKIECVRPG